MKTTSFHVGTPAPAQLCSNAGLMLLAATADAVKVADAIDVELAEWQNPNLLHTTGHTMTALALALALGGDDANDVDLLDPLVATGLIDQVPSDSTVHRRHAELAGLGSDGTTAILAGMKSARRAAWAACGTRNPQPGPPPTIHWSSTWTPPKSSPTPTKSMPPRHGRNTSDSTPWQRSSTTATG